VCRWRGGAGAKVAVDMEGRELMGVIKVVVVGVVVVAVVVVVIQMIVLPQFKSPKLAEQRGRSS
jgi:hypothetical protein